MIVRRMPSWVRMNVRIWYKKVIEHGRKLIERVFVHENGGLESVNVVYFKCL